MLGRETWGVWYFERSKRAKVDWEEGEGSDDDVHGLDRRGIPHCVGLPWGGEGRRTKTGCGDVDPAIFS